MQLSLCFSIHFVLCNHVISFSPTSVKGGERKTDPGCLPRIFLGHNLSIGSTSPGNISFQAFYTLQKLPLYVLFFMAECWQACLLTNHFRHQGRTRREQMALFLQITVPRASIMILAFAVKCIIYPLYNKQSTESKLRLVIALFAPLIGVLFTF